ncbi:hypothetical protein LIER_23775 [Lithospermum erythrorhizon]|uniref:Uncharacterized protein n=1 Tax=Lithospermum erythrorhizon TaxID=34254 RepID=A0AAV3QYR7_LITER
MEFWMRELIPPRFILRALHHLRAFSYWKLAWNRQYPSGIGHCFFACWCCRSLVEQQGPSGDRLLWGTSRIIWGASKVRFAFGAPSTSSKLQHEMKAVGRVRTILDQSEDRV